MNNQRIGKKIDTVDNIRQVIRARNTDSGISITSEFLKDNFSMHIVEEEEFYEKAYPSFKKVFNYDTDENYGFFSEIMISRTIIYPSYLGIDKAIPIDLIVKSAKEIGDNGCYYYRPRNFPYERDFYYSSFDDLLKYYDTNTLEHLNYTDYPIQMPSISMYSENGQWGITAYQCCEWGLLGGTSKFTKQLREYFPMLEKRVFSFLYALNMACIYDGTDYLTQVDGFIKSHLKHIYGDVFTSKILAMSPQELLDKSEATYLRW